MTGTGAGPTICLELGRRGPAWPERAAGLPLALPSPALSEPRLAWRPRRPNRVPKDTAESRGVRGGGLASATCHPSRQSQVSLALTSSSGAGGEGPAYDVSSARAHRACLPVTRSHQARSLQSAFSGVPPENDARRGRRPPTPENPRGRPAPANLSPSPRAGVGPGTPRGAAQARGDRPCGGGPRASRRAAGGQRCTQGTVVRVAYAHHACIPAAGGDGGGDTPQSSLVHRHLAGVCPPPRPGA